MNQVTFLLAVLVKKKILKVDEAIRLQKSLTESVTNANLSEMLEKVSKAMVKRDPEMKKVDASNVLKP